MEASEELKGALKALKDSLPVIWGKKWNYLRKTQYQFNPPQDKEEQSLQPLQMIAFFLSWAERNLEEIMVPYLAGLQNSLASVQGHSE